MIDKQVGDMAEIRIGDAVLGAAVRGWLELEGLAGADCVISENVDGTLTVECGGRCASVGCPLSFGELSAAVRSVIQPTEGLHEDSAALSTAAEKPMPEIDGEARSVTYCGRSAVLSPREFELFRYLFDRANATVPRRELCENVWHGEVTEKTNAVDVYVSYLRRRIEPLFGKGAIVSVRGEGYMLVL